MAVAVAPNTARPLDRPPFELSKPLPWSDAYISSFALWDIRISNRPVRDTDVTKLSVDDWMLHKDYVYADKTSLRRLQASEGSSSAPLAADAAPHPDAARESFKQVVFAESS
jgi:hypothetical protein